MQNEPVKNDNQVNGGVTPNESTLGNTVPPETPQVVNNNVTNSNVTPSEPQNNRVDNQSPMESPLEMGEAINMNSVSNVTPMTMSSNSGEVNQNNNAQKKSNKKLFIIIGIVVAVIILLLVVSFIYIKFKFTAPKFIDEKVEEFSATIDSMFSEYSLNSLEDTHMSGDLTLNTSMEDLASLNGLTVNFDVGYSLSKEIIDLNLELLNGSDSIASGEIYIDDTAMYIDSSEIFNQVLYSTLEENPFGDINSEEMQSLMDINNFKEFIKNFTKYIATALKEGEVNSSVSGLSAKYTYIINENNKEAFLNKLNELVDNDESMKYFLMLLTNTDDVTFLDVPDMTLEVEVSVPSGDVKNFNFVMEDLKVSLNEISNDNYELTINDSTVIDVKTDGDNINLFYEDDLGLFDITFNNKDYTLDANIETNGQVIKVAITNSNANTKNTKIELDGTSMEGTAINLIIDSTVVVKSNEESDTVGNITLTSDIANLELEYNVNTKVGKDLVSEKTFDDMKDINDLTSADENTINNNLINILSELFPELAGSINSSSEQSFLVNSNVILASYELSTASSVSCISITDLSNLGLIETDGTFQGKFVNNNDGSYTVWITDGNYMVVSKNINGNEITDVDIQEYDASLFLSDYYTCNQVVL